MMEFKEYLISKKIDPEKFKKSEPERWDEFLKIFEQVHPESFTAQKLFLINKLRRRYILEEAEQPKEEVKKAVAKPRMRPLPKK